MSSRWKKTSRQIMHICFLTNEYPPDRHGGIGTFTQTLGLGLAGRGHRVTVIGSYPVRRMRFENDQGVTVLRLPKSNLPGFRLMTHTRRLRKALASIERDHRIDILEAANLSLSLVPKTFPAAKLLRMHSTISTDKKPRVVRSWQIARSFDLADHIIAVSRSCADTNRRNLNLKDRPIEIIPNPVDTAMFRPAPPDLEQEGLILLVGTVCENKGVRELIQAMPEIVQSAPSAHLWVVGRDWQDPQTGKSFTSTLQKLIPPALGERIVFKGTVKHAEIPNLIAKAQVCVHPSHMENMPIAWIESMAMEKAIVASNTGPGPEVVEDGVSGLLCDPYDPKSIAEKIVTLLRNPGLRASLGKQARKRVLEHLSLDVLVERNEGFYERCIRRKKGWDTTGDDNILSDHQATELLGGLTRKT